MENGCRRGDLRVRRAAVGGGWRHRRECELSRKRDGLEPVYNIEVDGDHVYRVGEQGLLVHNASAPCDFNNLCGCDYFGPSFHGEDGKLYGPFDQNTPTVGVRATGVKARLCRENANRGGSPATDNNVAGWREARQAGLRGTFARANLLGQNIGGPGNVRANLVVTCQQSTNIQMYNSVERIVRQWIDGGLVVDYEVEPVYEGHQSLPERNQDASKGI